jgi:hypothetical protein
LPKVLIPCDCLINTSKSFNLICFLFQNLEKFWDVIEDQSKGWWMRLKIYGPKGYLDSVDFRVDIGWKQKSRRIHDSNAQGPHGRR